MKTVLLILSQTYVHRVGRTARAGKPGSAITLLEDNQMDHFDGMMTQAGKTASKIHKIRAGEQELQPYFEKYQEALEHLKAETEAKDEIRNQKHRNKKKRILTKTSPSEQL